MALRMIAGRTRELAFAQLGRELGIEALSADDGQGPWIPDPRLAACVQFERGAGGPAWWPFGWGPFGHKRWELFVDDGALQGGLQREVRAAQANAGLAALESEVRALRQGMARLVRSADLARLPLCGQALIDCYDHLCRVGMLPELAQELVLAAREELSGAAQEQAAVVQAAVRRQYHERLQLRAPRVVPGSGPLVIFLVGPTGVGKTTTAAKMAKRQALLDGRRVAIVNADATRPGAQQQLELLLQPLNLRVESLSRPAALTACLNRLADRDIILVDTAGVGRCDDEGLDQLHELIAAAPRRQTFLVLSASTSYDEMDNIVSAYGSSAAGAGAANALAAGEDGAAGEGATIVVDGIILTKTDETDAFGAAASLSCRCAIPIAYISAGRRVPQDLELATAERMSEMVLRGLGLSRESQARRSARPVAEPTPPAPTVVPRLASRAARPASARSSGATADMGRIPDPANARSAGNSLRQRAEGSRRGEEMAA